VANEEVHQRWWGGLNILNKDARIIRLLGHTLFRR